MCDPVSKTLDLYVFSIQRTSMLYRQGALSMCFRYKNAKLYRKQGVLHGFRYTKVRPCIEMEAFFEVFDTVELVMQGRKLTCAFEGLKDARKIHKLRFAYFINLMICRAGITS